MFDNMKDKAEQYAEENPDKVEKYSDKGIQTGGDKIDDATGGKYAQQMDKGQTMADEHIGDENAGGGADQADKADKGGQADK